MPRGSLLGGRFAEEFTHVASLEAGREVVERAVTLALGAAAVGLSTSGEPLDEGGAEEVARNLERTEQPVATLPKRQGRFSPEEEYLGQVLGQDSETDDGNQEKESASPTRISSNRWSASNYLIRLPRPSGTAEHWPMDSGRWGPHQVGAGPRDFFWATRVARYGIGAGVARSRRHCP